MTHAMISLSIFEKCKNVAQNTLCFQREIEVTKVAENGQIVFLTSFNTYFV